jgi:beta-aspartyl-dipeptidase (metallo-type)
MGDMPEGKNHFQPVYDVLNCSTLPITQFLPTHVNRNSDIFEQAKEYGKKGGYLDITASSYPYYPQYETKPSKAFKELIASGVDIGKITISSDGGGSLPDFDINGNLISLKVGDMFSIFREMREAVLDEKMNLQDAILPVTANVADIYKLNRKGYLKERYDADIVLLDKDLNINYVIAKGNILVADGIILKKGTFEK